MLNLNLQTGGAERQLVHLANHWRQTDCHAEVVLLERQGVWVKELPPHVPVHSLLEQLPSGSLAKALKILRLIPRLRRFFLQHQCDIVLTFLWLPTVMTALALRGLRSRPVLIWSLQSDLAQDFRLHWDGWLRHWIVHAFLPKQVVHFIAISRGIKSGIQKLLRFPDEQVTVIPNSIDLARIAEMAEKQNNILPKRAPIRLISVGRMHPAKDIGVLLRALSILNKRGVDLEGYIIGDGPERERLIQSAGEAGLNSHAHFVGHITNPYAWLQTADIFVSSSKWETFGISIVEAMALGLPIVATKTDGACDIIRDGVDGFLVPIGDYRLIAERVMLLIEQPALQKKFAMQAREKAQEFDAPCIANRYMKVFEKLLAERKPCV